MDPTQGVQLCAYSLSYAARARSSQLVRPMTASGDIIYRTWTLLVFIVSLFFVFFPQKIRVPSLHKRIPSFSIPINFAVAPCIGALLLLATLALPPHRFWQGLVGDRFVHPWQVDAYSGSSAERTQIVILFYAVAYLCLSLDLTGIFKWLTLKTKRRAGAGCISSLLTLDRQFRGAPFWCILPAGCLDYSLNL